MPRVQARRRARHQARPRRRDPGRRGRARRDHGDRAASRTIEVSDAGLREGVFLERFLDDRDPPLFDDVRARGGREPGRSATRRTSTTRAHVAEAVAASCSTGCAMAGLADAVDGDDRELLWAACLLHDIGTAVDYDDHHKHSRYLILNGGLPGFSPRELELIALIARYHRKGEPDASELGPLARKKDDAAAGAAVRRSSGWPSSSSARATRRSPASRVRAGQRHASRSPPRRPARARRSRSGRRAATPTCSSGRSARRSRSRGRTSPAA